MSENKKEWREYSQTFKQLLCLDSSPVAVTLTKNPQTPSQKKVRICRAILDASKGTATCLGAENNACFGASWHLGFHKIKDPKVSGMVKKFVVEGEKLFSSYEALDNLMSQFVDVPDNSDSFFLLSPLENSEHKPDLVLFVVNAEAACRLLTFLTFLEGKMPKIKIGGPTCRMIIMEPLLTGEPNISFYDYTARKMCNVEKDKLIISFPYNIIPRIIDSIDKCSAGTAKIEFPPEFREFLQKRLTPAKNKTI
ncbi:MAG: DUF169 domain-containing protein [Candidatus Omnitrophica bacterium]|nr:DUF169 domain-containing protein [Candidatus Omnitrophota bacterium]HOX54570.1 DUF169 domain-containing protein [Candidatus Omnitrophota bacterium]